MSGVNRSRYHGFCSQQGTHCLSKSIAAVGNGKQIERILWPNAAPAASNGLRGRAGCQRAFEFVWSD
jgi:hypothetical protein